MDKESKVLVVLRISTDRQDLTAQKKEMEAFCEANGFDRHHREFIEGIGASAIKLNKKYKEMIATIKNKCLNEGFNTVAVWHLNRLGRNSEVLQNFKSFFVEHQIQFLTKESSIKLLNDDGTLNSGYGLVFSLFAEMCEQDMREKMAKFKRGKKENAKNGKYCGGYVQFGYTVDENGYFQIKEDEAEIVRRVYSLYTEKKMNMKDIANKLYLEGICENYALARVHRILTQEVYYKGISNTGSLNQVYPTIIDEATFKKAAKIRSKRNTNVRKTKEPMPLQKLVKCPMGNHTLTETCDHRRNTRSLRCAVALSDNLCDFRNLFVINELEKYIVRVSLYIAQNETVFDKNKFIDECNAEISELKLYIKTLNKQIAEIDRKKTKILDYNVEGLYTAEETKVRLQKQEDNKKDLVAEKSNYEMQIKKLMERMEKDENLSYWERMEKIYNIDDLSQQEWYDLTHKYIREIKTHILKDGYMFEVIPYGDWYVNKLFLFPKRKDVHLFVANIDFSNKETGELIFFHLNDKEKMFIAPQKFVIDESMFTSEFIDNFPYEDKYWVQGNEVLRKNKKYE